MSITYINFLLDQTGSMSGIRDATIDGFNEFVKGQRAEPGKTRWTLTLFDSIAIETVFENVKGREVPELTKATYSPRAMTPLYDAVGETLTKGLAHAKAQKIRDKKYDGHILVIMTDGLENNSREWSVEEVQKLIKKAENKDWQIIFLGANQDAWDTGINLGMDRGATITYAATPDSVAATMDSAVLTATAYRNTGQAVSHHVDTTDGTIKDREDEKTTSKS